MTSVPLSYMIRQSQLACAQSAVAPWWEYFAGGNYLPGRFDDGSFGYTGHFDVAHWSRDAQRIQSYAGYGLGVLFGFDGFDPALSKWHYGPEQVVSDQLEVLGAHTYLLDNSTGRKPVSFDESESVTLSQSRTSTLHAGISLDLGSKTKGSIAPAGTGVSLEQEFSVQLGIKVDTTTAKAESESRTDSVSLATEVPAGRKVLATISAPTVVSVQDFDIDGVWLSSVQLEANSRALGGNAAKLSDGVGFDPAFTRYDPNDPRGWSVRFETWADFEAMCNGVSVDFPSVMAPTATDDILRRLGDPAARRVVWSGQVQRRYQQSAAYKFADVTDEPSDALIEQHQIQASHVRVLAA